MKLPKIEFRPLLPLLPAMIVGLFLFARSLHSWDLYSVNVLFRDQWDFWIPMFDEDAGLWEMFNLQHGPHKMGIGYFHIYVVAALTDWNLRAESLSLVITSLGSTVIFLWLKFRLYERWHYTDVLIPLTTLSFVHYEIYYFGTNPSLNVVPLLLVALIGVCMTVVNEWIRYSSLLILGFFATYTGFAIFAGIIVPIVCLAEAVRSYWREGWSRVVWLALGAAVLGFLGFGSFFLDYRFLPAVKGFEFPHDPVWEYAVLLSKYFAYFFNLAKIEMVALVATVFVIFLFVCVLWICVRLFFKDESKERTAMCVAAFFMLFGMAYALNMAVGRVSLGTGAGMTSRYLIFFAPFWIGAYFFLLRHKSWIAMGAAGLLAVLFLYGDQTFQSSREPGLRRLAINKKRWVQAYKMSEDIGRANQIANFKVYPFERAYPAQEKRIAKMREHGLGFMAD